MWVARGETLCVSVAGHCWEAAIMADGPTDLYRLWIEEIGRLREGRQRETHFFVTVNLAAFGALGILLGPNSSMPAHMVYAIVLAMILVNVSWIATDRWFSRITWKKLEFIHRLEQDMDLKPITDELRNFKWRRRIGWFLGAIRVLPYLAMLGFLYIGLLHSGLVARWGW